MFAIVAIVALPPSPHYPVLVSTGRSARLARNSNFQAISGLIPSRFRWEKLASVCGVLKKSRSGREVEHNYYRSLENCVEVTARGVPEYSSARRWTQVFTNLGVQECGEFMRGSDPLRPMGHCIGMVYRSWAFLQRQARTLEYEPCQAYTIVWFPSQSSGSLDQNYTRSNHMDIFSADSNPIGSFKRENSPIYHASPLLGRVSQYPPKDAETKAC